MANTITGNGTIEVEWGGGAGVFKALAASGFGGATVDLQFSTDGGTTKAAIGSDTTLTANGGGAFIAGKETLYIVTSNYANDITYTLLPAEGKNFA